MILGAVEYAHDPQEAGTPEWCRVRPVFKSEDYRWAPVDDSTSDFPTTGLVFWYGPPSEAAKDTFWLGTTYQNPGAGDDKRPDLYGLDEVERPYEFIELRGDVDESELRHLCASGHFSFSHHPIGPILVKIPGTTSEWVGPIELLYTKDSDGRFVGSHSGLSGFVPVHEIDSQSIQELRLEGDRIRILRPKATIGGIVRYFSAQDDKNLLLSALQRIRKVDRSAAEAMEVTRSVFGAYVDTLSNADLIGDVALKENARQEALRMLIERMDSDFFARHEIAESLLSQESVQAQLDRAIDKKVQEYGEEIAERVKGQQEELSKEIEVVESQLQELNNEAEEKAKTIADQRKQIEKQEEEIDKVAHDLSRRLRKAVSEVLSHPVSALGQHAVVQALVNAVNQEAISQAKNVSLSDDGTLLPNLADLCGALIAGAKSLSIPNQPLLNLVGSLISRRTPICFGSQARVCSEFVGSMIGGSNVFEIIVPSSIFNLNDLLNLPAVNTSVRGVGRLSEILKQSENFSEMVVIILSGVNRAPLEVAFENLIPDTLDAKSEKYFPFTSNDQNQPPEVLCIRQNVQLIGTLMEGPSTFPVSRELRNRISFIDTDCFINSEFDNSIELPSGFRVSTDSWKEWRKAAISEPWPLAGMQLPNSVISPEFNDYQSELQIFNAVYGGSAPEQAFVEWAIARLAGAIDESELKSIAEGVGENLVQLIDDAIQCDRNQRIAKFVQSMEI